MFKTSTTIPKKRHKSTTTSLITSILLVLQKLNLPEAIKMTDLIVQNTTPTFGHVLIALKLEQQ
ncbi:22782_t:CDS:1, partial [Gigaspora rosea]